MLRTDGLTLQSAPLARGGGDGCPANIRPAARSPVRAPSLQLVRLYTCR
ncbi:MAG: hypothetical protein JO276_04805 [Sphingomonadaceae bacterium]|nr:hypothetical protein [Sphingomonadaceae bacterium]